MNQTALHRHQEKVRTIAESVKHHNATAETGDYFSLKKANIPHTVPGAGGPKRNEKRIDITALTEILEIDPERKICIAESGVEFQKLIGETLKYGLVPKTVSELKSITIGGAVAGCSVESMSYKYGGFHDSCIEYEIVTGQGEIMIAGRNDHEDIFQMVHGSFGTVGILTLLTFSLVPAKPYVHTVYTAFPSFDSLMKAVRRHYNDQDLDFMDAIVHSPDMCVLCSGTFVEKAPYANQYFLKPFYRSTKRLAEDYMRTEDYFFRYDADCHWIIRNYGLENPVLRRLAAPFAVGSSNVLKLARRFPFLTALQTRPEVIVDVFIPYGKIEEFFAWYDSTFRYYPLWIVPYKIGTMYPWVNPDILKNNHDDLFIDCAIYGFHQHGELNYYKALEEKVYELGGIKTLITHNYYTEAEFWASYNQEAYNAVKVQTDPHGTFRDLYAKTRNTGDVRKTRRITASEALHARPFPQQNPLRDTGL